jgi:hypothetical protein
MALCWICNAHEGSTGEHRIKRSDIKSVFGAVDPLHLHDRKRSNIKLQSLNSKKLKSTAPMCSACNNARTQPHDYAWESMSEAIRNKRPRLAYGDIVRANRIFRYDTTNEMLNLHLYFVKWLGCQIVESKIPISPTIDTFSSTIMNQKPHPNIWLAFGISGRDESLSSSDIGAATFGKQPRAYDYLCRIYTVDRLEVRVRFSRVKLKDDWHPSDRNRFKIANLTGDHKK